jgi:hypothetical protein
VLSDTIDAIQAGLTGIGLPAGTQRRSYTKPVVITPDVCPLLAVYPKDLEPIMLDTESQYQNDDEIIVLWAVAAPDSLELGRMADAAGKQALDQHQLIRSTLEQWGVGIPNLVQQNEATVGKTRFGLLEGGVWAAETVLKVTSWS